MTAQAGAEFNIFLKNKEDNAMSGWAAAGAIGASLVGGILGNKAAKQQANAQRYAAELQAQAYNDARPYVTNMYRQGQDALNASLDAGYYTGPTYAQLDPLQRQAAETYRTFGNEASGDAYNFMQQGRGFGQNYQDLYNRAGQDMLGNAVDYAAANTEPLLKAAMYDDYRTLNERTKPGINQTAAASNNVNSSRAAMADYMAERNIDERRDRMATSIQNDLIDRSLNAQQSQFNNLTNANKNLAGLYNTGFMQGGEAAKYMNAGGGMLREDLQNQYTDAKQRYEGQRDFELNQLAAYNAGILGNASNSVGQVQPVTANPMMGGLSGALAGLGFYNQYGNQIANMFSNSNTPLPAGTPGSTQIGTWNPSYGYGGL